MGKDKKQTVTQRLDPASQGQVDAMRRQARSASDIALNTPGSFIAEAPDISAILGNMQQFLNPYTEQVIGGVRSEFDQLRAAATRGVNQAATAAGSFGGSRHGVAEGVQLGELGRAQAQQIGGLLSNQFNTALSQGLNFSEYQRALRERQLQEPLFRSQMAQGFLRQGLGPTGSTTTQTIPGNLLGDLAGIALTVGGAYMGGPSGAATGAQVGRTVAPSFNPPSFFPEPNYNPLSSFGR